VIIGQYSQITNQAGVDYVQQHISDGYRIEMLTVDDPNAMHIDDTILPLREGLLIYNPRIVTEAEFTIAFNPRRLGGGRLSVCVRGTHSHGSSALHDKPMALSQRPGFGWKGNDRRRQ
jgi:N-dimethylarginine dimethylaminohydrolase